MPPSLIRFKFFKELLSPLHGIMQSVELWLLAEEWVSLGDVAALQGVALRIFVLVKFF